MRWAAFAVFGFLAIVLESGLRSRFAIQSLGDISPSFVAVLVVYVSLFAPRMSALWACWTLGLFVDLMTPMMYGSGEHGPVIGAHALGYTFACFALLQVRPMLFRRRALTVAVMAGPTFLAMSLVAIFVFVVHGWYPGEQLAWSSHTPLIELVSRIGSAVYTSLLALLLGPLLLVTTPLWKFSPAMQRYGMRRGKS